MLKSTPLASAANAPCIVFYVQYLLGIGHVQRSSLIVRALCDLGADVHVIFGGMPLPSMSFGSARVHQLTAVKSADTGFSQLVKADGSEFTANDKAQRCAQLLALCEQLKPALIVTETYPFGRRQMRFELQPLLQWVKTQVQPPILVASVRDILQRRSPKREQECIDTVHNYYQHVLVHGDKAFYPLEQSFAPATQISDKLSYSGYVCPKLKHTAQLPHKSDSGRTNNKIVVSIGGGSVGKEILSAALALYHSGFAADLQWLLITGPNMAAADKAFFKQQQQPNLEVRELANDFLTELSNAYVSVSMAGYNTVMDLLLTKVAAVVIPFEGEGETEQMARSEVLSAANVLNVIRQSELHVQSLKEAIIDATTQHSAAINIDNRGAQNSAQLLMDWAHKRNPSEEQDV